MTRGVVQMGAPKQMCAPFAGDETDLCVFGNKNTKNSTKTILDVFQKLLELRDGAIERKTEL